VDDPKGTGSAVSKTDPRADLSEPVDIGYNWSKAKSYENMVL